MDFRDLIANARIKKQPKRFIAAEYTSDVPPDIYLNTIEDLVKICSYFGLPQPTREMFEDESQLEKLVLFIKDLHQSLLNFGIVTEKIEIDKKCIEKAKALEQEYDKMEIEIAKMEDRYNILCDFIKEAYKYHGKNIDLNINDLNSTNYVRSTSPENIFIDKSSRILDTMDTNKTHNITFDAGIISSYVNMHIDMENKLKNSYFIKYKDKLLNFDTNYLCRHKSYIMYKNYKKREQLLRELYNMEDSLLKALFIELLNKKVVFLSEISNKFGCQRNDLFKIAYILNSKHIVEFDVNQECIRLKLS